MADQLKEQGNKAFAEKRYDEAVRLFSEAIELAPTNHVLYSNRSGAYASLNRYEDALADASKTVELKPDFVKGYSRKATALRFLKRFDEAIDTYQAGLKIDPNNAGLKKDLEETEMEINSSSGANAFQQIFNRPDFYPKLHANPKTAAHLKDPAFVQKLEMIRRSPAMATTMMQDPRIMDCIGALLGLNFDSADVPGSDESETPAAAPAAASKPEPKKAPEPEPEPTELTEEQIKLKEANAEKEKGNAAYKSKNFELALTHYKKAQELAPTEMSFIANESAVYFEQKEYEKCIETANRAVEVGRENRASFETIAKAYARIGNAAHKLGRLEDAKQAYERSITEHRTSDTREKLQKVEKEIKERERNAYINPELAEVAKQEGNEFFKAGDFPKAVERYSEAIKRNPADHTLFSNRAAAYTKLLSLNEALKDCDECLRLNPTFAKGYTRRGAALLLMREHEKAIAAYEKALDLDKDNQDAREGLQRCMIAVQKNEEKLTPEERQARAMADPEVQEILSDPAMRLILEQMTSDPRAAQDHFKNPVIAKKIQKLIAAGVVRTK